MAHKTLISGTAYSVTGGRELIGGTGYDCKAGKTLIGGTAFTVPFSKGIPLSTITPGAILYLNESGSPVPFYIAKHDYESGLNGAGRTLLVRKDCYKMRTFGQGNNYETSFIDADLQNTWPKLLDSNIQTLMGTTKFYYYRNGSSGMVTLNRAAFQLSHTELGSADTFAAKEGTALPIASVLKIANIDGHSTGQWTRTHDLSDYVHVFAFGSSGRSVSSKYSDSLGVRPAFTLPATTAVIANPDGTYTLAA